MGRFLIDRAIFEKQLWRDPVAFRLFFFLIGNAVFKDGVKIAGQVLKRGQLLRSYRKLQDDLEYVENNQVKRFSVETIRRSAIRLKDDGRILLHETALGTLFTLVNYEQYQAFSPTENCELVTPLETVPRQQRDNKNEGKLGKLNYLISSDAEAPEKNQKQGKKKNETSPQARVVVNHLTMALKSKGAREGQFSTQWFFAGVRVADKMLNAFSVVELEEAINYLVDHPLQGQWIRSMTDVQKNITLWQRRNEVGNNVPRPSAILKPAQSYSKTGVTNFD